MDIPTIYDKQTVQGLALLFFTVLLSFSDVMTLRVWSKFDGAVIRGTSMTTSYGTLLQALLVVLIYGVLIGVMSMVE